MNLLRILVQKGILLEKDVSAVKEAQKTAPTKARTCAAHRRRLRQGGRHLAGAGGRVRYGTLSI